MRDKVLIIDDEPNLRMILGEILNRAGYLTFTFESFSQAKNTLNHEDIDVVLTDLQMPEASGMDVLNYCKQYSPDLPVILITAYGTVERAVSALKAGAFDFISKPIENEELFRTLEKAIQSRLRRRKEPGLEIMSAIGVGPIPFPLFGDSNSTKTLRNEIERVAQSSSPVLLYGEVGTGKRSVAYEIHRKSMRSRGSFIQINLDAIPAVFQVTELFGVEKGATPMSFFSKPGSFELAQGGTLLIDEVGALSVEAQNELFSVLDQESFSRLGGLKKFPLDLRIIVTSSRDLSESVKAGKFHVELFYKLSVQNLSLIPLRERKDDLISHFVPIFIERACRKNGIAQVECSEEALAWFRMQDWPGNLGQLERTILRAVHSCTGGLIDLKDLSLE
jgi:DNA-binding NtrC family response regulator